MSNLWMRKSEMLSKSNLWQAYLWAFLWKRITSQRRRSPCCHLGAKYQRIVWKTWCQILTCLIELKITGPRWFKPMARSNTLSIWASTLTQFLEMQTSMSPLSQKQIRATMLFHSPSLFQIASKSPRPIWSSSKTSRTSKSIKSWMTSTLSKNDIWECHVTKLLAVLLKKVVGSVPLRMWVQINLALFLKAISSLCTALIVSLWPQEASLASRVTKFHQKMVKMFATSLQTSIL